MMCRACDLDGPCSDAGCAVTVHRCTECTTPWPSASAARRCAELDDDPRAAFVD
jgi:hypothetical protein